MTDIIVKNGSRILVPHEYDKMREQLQVKHRVICDALLHSHMRPEEFRRFAKHSEWFSSPRKCIDLPKGAILKIEAKQKERSCVLSNTGVMAIERFADAMNAGGRVPTRHALMGDMKRAAERAGLDPTGISPKCLRKSMISWLIAAYPEKGIWIATSAGHDVNTMQQHYLGIGFANRDIIDMKERLVGWG